MFMRAAWFKDACCVAFLMVLAHFLFVTRAPSLSMSSDGFVFAYNDYVGHLPLVSWNFWPGRPCLGIHWYLAGLLGGSVTSYNTISLACLGVSAVLVYAIIRTQLPGHYGWAFAAATLKLAWPANHRVFDNSALAIHAVEIYFWLAIWMFVLLCRPGAQDRPWHVRVLAYIAMAIGLLVTTGTYQTPIALLLLCPLVLLTLGAIDWRSRQVRIAGSVWYLLMGLMIAFVAWHMKVYAAQDNTYAFGNMRTAGSIVGNTLQGAKAATIDSVAVPMMRLARHWRQGHVEFRLMFAAGAFAVMFWWLMRRRDSVSAVDASAARTPRWLAWRLIACGVVCTLAAIVAPAALTAPIYGTRFLHFAAIRPIMILLAVATAAAMTWPRLGVGGAMVLFTVTTTTSALEQRESGRYSAWRVQPSRWFFESLLAKVPTVPEGAVVVVENCPLKQQGIQDLLGTWVFRDLTDTHTTYLLFEEAPVLAEDSANEIIVKTNLDLARPTMPSDDLIGRYKQIRLPCSLPGSEKVAFRLPAEKVLWLRWSQRTRSLSVSPSNVATVVQLDAGPKADYGRRLFP